MNDKTTVRTDLDEATIDALDSVAMELRKRRRDRRLGVGTVAAELITRMIAEHPEWVAELFSESPAETQYAPPEKKRSFR